MKKKINIRGRVVFGERLEGHTTFHVGGPADMYAVPRDAEDVASILRYAGEEGLPVFILGGGANIVVSDAGIRGIVVDTAELRSLSLAPDSSGGALLTAGAGLPLSDASEFAAAAGFAGLEIFYSMPGSVGGSVYMNARCYGRSVSDIIVSAPVLDRDGTLRETPLEPSLFDYKKSPFQGSGDVILGAKFRLSKAGGELRSVMEGYRADRTAKGHFALPSAGSVFKNNREFGEPTGVIIDRLGLKGLAVGGAKVSDLHGNIIVNTGNATAADIRLLVEELERRVYEARGFRLEREVIFAGSW